MDLCMYNLGVHRIVVVIRHNCIRLKPSQALKYIITGIRVSLRSKDTMEYRLGAISLQVYQEAKIYSECSIKEKPGKVAR